VVLKSRLFWKFYGGYVAIIIATAITIATLVSRNIEADVLEETRSSLQGNARLFREIALPVLEGDLSPEELVAFEERVRRLGEETGTRFTLIDEDGRVLADSSEDPKRMELHDQRSEIIQARASGIGAATRFSRTVGARMMYFALATRSSSGSVGFVRTALSLRKLDERLARLRHVGVMGAVLAALLALGLGVFVARSFTQSLLAMGQAARAIASGDYRQRLTFRRRDEIEALARSLNLMAEELELKIQTVTDEKNRLQTILSGMVEGVVATDAEGQVLHMNSVAGRTLGIAPKAARGKPLRSMTRVQEMIEPLFETIRTGVVRQREIVFRRYPKDQILEIYSAPIRDSQGALAGAIMVLHDVTELRRLEAVRRDFVASASHEMKTPITVIRGAIETLLDDPAMAAGARERFHGKIRDQTNRLSSIVSDLLTLARAESSPESLEREPLDLREPVRESFRALSPSAEAKRISMALSCPEEAVPVLGEWSSLRLVIDNLLDNAVKYTPAGGKVEVRLRMNGESAFLEVEDTGIGIESHEIERIFERFYRVDKARSRELGGTGLGLSIVRHLVQAHGGDVVVESVPGKGALFRVGLPIYEAA
jgi:two-component system phosphate regulon sensor histidine kinase PhoR